MSDNNHEQRAYKRLPATNDYRAQIDGSDKIQLKNISLFGICLMALQHLDKNSSHEITLYSGDTNKITLHGDVIWSYPIGPSEDEAVTYYETGFKFTGMDSNKKKSLEDFITSIE